MKSYFLFFVVALTLVTCNPIETIDSEPAQIRVRNVSNFDFDEIVIWEENLGPLESLRNSDYFIKEPAYNKASISVKIDTFQFGMTVIDYVGETPLRRCSRRLLKYPTCADICQITFSLKRTQPFSSFLTLLILSQLRPGIFLRLAASESDDLRLQHQSEYFNTLLVI